MACKSGGKPCTWTWSVDVFLISVAVASIRGQLLEEDTIRDSLEGISSSSFIKGFYEDLPDLTVPSAACQRNVTEFGYAVSNFTLCSVLNARPINFCTGCIHEYLGVLKSREGVSKATDELGKDCDDYFVNLDRLEVVTFALQNVERLWTRGNCQNCFESDEQGRTTSNQTTYTREFHRLFSSTSLCLKGQHQQEESNETCRSCRPFYDKLNAYYTTLEEKFGDAELCWDIIDTMNRTREVWSSVYTCVPLRKSEFWLLFSMGVIGGALPLSFYLISFIFSKAEEVDVVPQRRMIRPEVSPVVVDQADRPINIAGSESSVEVASRSAAA